MKSNEILEILEVAFGLEFLTEIVIVMSQSDENECMLWQGRVGQAGYGYFVYEGYCVAAHRLAYFTFKGPIPDDLNVCHSCDVPRCVNPKHLWAGTQADNVHDSIKKGRR